MVVLNLEYQMTLAARRILLASTLFVVTMTARADAGPPFISVELPANPLDRTTRGAYLLVHGFHHEVATAQRLVGTAEGIVDGARSSVPIVFEATSRTGVFAVRRTWGTKGTWLLVLRAGPDEWPATALVGIGADGAVRSVRVPMERRDGWDVPMKVEATQVDRELRQLAARESGAPVELGLIGAAALLPLLALRWRRRAVID